eukprot:TRINITY_DN8319_c1_g3_i1.p1 TRINITY_DN8319_c1_g3~~TRINITY_DN8319_c1_g3_i1.p1  ORF type:complete len:2368 (+),score=863.33 TRINITY_DN8319_c1_g3_i1:64-7104(+)
MPGAAAARRGIQAAQARESAQLKADDWLQNAPLGQTPAESTLRKDPGASALQLKSVTLDLHDAALRQNSAEQGLGGMLKSSILKPAESRPDRAPDDRRPRVQIAEAPVSVAPPPEPDGKDEGGENAEDSDSDTEENKVDTRIEGWPAWRNKVRKVVLFNAWFERFWLLIIILNCVTLAMEDPTDQDCETSVCQFTKKTDYVFTGLFTVECAVKIVGLGFCYPARGAYIRDEWNILDFLIVVTGDAALAMDLWFDFTGPGLTGLRAFRLLRPLKAVQAFPAVRVLVQSILESLPKLMDVCVLYSFFLLVMGIVAVQQWKGQLRWRCVHNFPANETFNESLHTIAEERVCATHGSQVLVGGHHCEWNQECLQVADNPHYGKVGFDNIGIAALTLFTALTLEGWTESMYETMDGTTWIAALFWVILIIFGAFFILNLTIVIITEAFEMKQFAVKTAAFRAIDADGGGELDRDEVRKLLKKMTGARPSDEYLDKVFSEMDEDGGGTVSMEEFLAYTTTHPALASSVIAGKSSSTEGLARDMERLANQVPLVSHIKNTLERVKEFVHKPRERSPSQDTIYQFVADSRVRTRYPRIHHFFNRFIMTCIMLNTLVLALEHHEEPGWFESLLWWFNSVFTFIFAGECVLKLYGYGVGMYFGDSWNTFDFLIVVLSMFDFFFGGGGGGVSAFRAFRVLRVLKLARQVPLLQRWIGILISSMKAAAILTALLGLVIFIVALLGMQLFGGEFCFMDEDWNPDARGVTAAMRQKGRHCGGVPRSNYDSVWSAFITTFQILTGEDWNIVMYTGMRTTGDWVCIYFCLYYVLGNYMMLNLFIAVLLNNRDLKDSGSQITQRSNDSLPEADELESPVVDPDAALDAPGSPTEEWRKLGGRLPSSLDCDDDVSSPVARPAAVMQEAELVRRELGPTDALIPLDALKRLKKPPDPIPNWLRKYMNRGNSFIIFGEDNKVRLILARISSHGCFELVVLLAIAISTCTLAVEDPRKPPDHPDERLLQGVDFVMVWVFLAECLFKSVSYGLVLHPDSYLRRESWNRLDFVIVVVSTAAVVIPGGDRASFVKIMRTLRPLRFINKSKGMKVVVQALIRSVKPLSNVLVISGVVWLIFGILGVQSFGGMFYRCGLDAYGDQETEEGRGNTKQGANASFIFTAADCLNRTKCEGIDDRACRWMNYNSNFDDIFAAFVTLFEISSLEGWVQVMYLGIDTVGPYQAPRRDNSPFAALYFLIFVVFGAFFIINMFIGVLIDTYYNEKEKAQEDGKRSMFSLDDEQIRWIEQHQVMLDVLADKRARVTDDQELNYPQLWFIQTSAFDAFITACIVLNVVVMALEHYPQDQTWDHALEWANTAFFFIFAAEAVLKIMGLGIGQYLSDTWNRFDFFIVVTSFAGLMMSIVVTVGPVTGVFRILRLARLLRMVKRAKGIKRILQTLYISLPSLINVAGILFLLFFIYAVLGVKLFAKVKRGENIGPYANFDNFGFAMLLLLRASTGEAWHTLMDDMRARPPDCEPRLDNCIHDRIAAPAYFCTFVLSGMYILLNLFIAVILDAFSEAGTGDEPENKLTKDYMEKVRLEWEKRAMMMRGELGPGSIAKDQLREFLQAIGPPLGPPHPKEMTRKKFEYWLMPIDLKSDTFGMINQTELMAKLFSSFIRRQLTDDDTRLAQWEQLRDELDQKHQQLTKQSTFALSNAPSLSNHLAAARVQALLKGWIVRRYLTMHGMRRSEDGPQRPLSAYFHFMDDQWDTVRERMQSARDAAHALESIQREGGEDGALAEEDEPPKVTAVEVVQRIHELWHKETDAEQRRSYQRKAADDADRHKADMRRWRALHPRTKSGGRTPLTPGRRASKWCSTDGGDDEDSLDDTITRLRQMEGLEDEERTDLQRQLQQAAERIAELESQMGSPPPPGSGQELHPTASSIPQIFRPGQAVSHRSRGPGTVDEVTPSGVKVTFPNGETRNYPPAALHEGRLRPQGSSLLGGPLSNSLQPSLYSPQKLCDALPVLQRAVSLPDADTPLLSAAATPDTDGPGPTLSSLRPGSQTRPADYVPPTLPPLPPPGRDPSCALHPLAPSRRMPPLAPQLTPPPVDTDDAPPGPWPPSPRLQLLSVDAPPGSESVGLFVDPQSLLVARVDPGSAAHAAGLRPGMRLHSVDGEECSTAAQAADRLRRAAGRRCAVGAWSADPAEQLVAEFDSGRDGGLDFAEFRRMSSDLGLPGPRTEADFAAVCSRHSIRAAPGFRAHHIRAALRKMQPAQQRRVREHLARCIAPAPPQLGSGRGPLGRGSLLSGSLLSSGALGVGATPSQRPAQAASDAEKLRQYYSNWASLTPEQRAEYFIKYRALFDGQR